MTKLCVGGVLGEEWTAYTREDQAACEESGGQLKDVGGAGGCATSSVAALTLPPKGLPRGALAALMLGPFRDAMTQLQETELGVALKRANALVAPSLAGIDESDALRIQLVEAFASAGALAAAFSRRQDTARFEEAQLRQFSRLAEALSSRVEDDEARAAIKHVHDLIRPLAGRSVREIRADLLGTVPKPPLDVAAQAPSAALITATLEPFLFRHHLSDRIGDVARGPKIADIIGLAEAQRVIGAKAAALGWVGATIGDTEAVPGGYRQRYANADIFAGPDGRAFEVHGDIRAKYDALGGPGGLLGLPVTDETVTPDGIGRYNHFSRDGSIYWTPSTGPMMVRGRVRQEWQSHGWERGPMGYPVRDQQALSGLSPADKPNLGWCLFENGAIMSLAGAGATALAAEINPDQLRVLVRRFFDQRLKAANGDIGLEAQVETLAVSGWSYGFWSAVPRSITFGLHGFHDNGLLPDTTFDLQIRLRFSTTWPMSFTYPGSMSLIAALDWLHVHTTGLGHGDLANGLKDGIWNAFHRGGPDPDHPEVPDGAMFLTSFSTGANQQGNGNLDVIEALTTAAGGLQILLNPLPPVAGGFRKAIAQQQVNGFLEG